MAPSLRVSHPIRSRIENLPNLSKHFLSGSKVGFWNSNSNRWFSKKIQSVPFHKQYPIILSPTPFSLEIYPHIRAWEFISQENGGRLKIKSILLVNTYRLYFILAYPMFPCILINCCHPIGYQFQLHQSDWLEHEASACYQLGNWLRCRLRLPLDGNKDMPFSLIHSGSSQIVAIETIWFWYIVRLLVNLNGTDCKMSHSAWVIPSFSAGDPSILQYLGTRVPSSCFDRRWIICWTFANGLFSLQDRN